MGTWDHPLALVHEQYLPDESVKVRVVRCRRAQSRTAHRLQRDEDQGRLFSSHNAMPCVVPAPSNAHAFTLVSVVQTGISSRRREFLLYRVSSSRKFTITSCFTLVCTKLRQMATLIFSYFGPRPPFLESLGGSSLVRYPINAKKPPRAPS